MITAKRANEYSQAIGKISANIPFDKRDVRKKIMESLVNSDFNIFTSFLREKIYEELTWASYPTVKTFIHDSFNTNAPKNSLQSKAKDSLEEKLYIAYKECSSVDTVNETIAEIISQTPVFEIQSLMTEDFNEIFKITFDITPVELILHMAERLPFEAEIEYSNWDRNQMLQRILEKNREYMVFNYLYSKEANINIDYTNDFKQMFYLQYVYENKYSPECLKAFEEACERTLNHYSLSDIKLIKAKENMEKESMEDIER